jgi:hypothetical protein
MANRNKVNTKKSTNSLDNFLEDFVTIMYFLFRKAMECFKKCACILTLHSQGSTINIFTNSKSIANDAQSLENETS